MNKEEMILLNNYLQETIKEDASSELKILAEKLDLMVKSILLQEQFQKEVQEITNKIDNLTK